jgi:hypothetical protein
VRSCLLLFSVLLLAAGMLLGGLTAEILVLL